MSLDELWKLHEEVTTQLVQKLCLEEIDLEERLRHLQGADNPTEKWQRKFAAVTKA